MLYGVDEQCFVCDTVRPDDGWLPVAISGDPWLGKVLAERYLVTRVVHATDHARVYIADSRIIPRSFAIKVLNIGDTDPDDEDSMGNRLRREVEALGSLRNPHVVNYYDVFDADDENIALVTDLIEGETLNRLVDGQPLALVRAITLSRQLANGLFEAHQRGLVHRDLKPPNVMVERLPVGDEFVRILDFGVSWAKGTSSSTGSSLFASPERIAGREVDHRSDLYSLGALMFFMLTGRPPHDEMTVSDADLLEATETPTLEDIVGEIFPAQIEALVSRLLEKEPSSRPESVARVLQWLDDIANDLLSHASEAFKELSEPSETSSPSSPSDGTLYGLPGERSSAKILRVEPSEISTVSEASVAEVGTTISLIACAGEGFAYVHHGQIGWGGGFAGTAPIMLDGALEYTSLAVSAGKIVLGTHDGQIILANAGKEPVVAYEDPRRAAIGGLAITPDGADVVAGSASGRLYIGGPEGFNRLGAGEGAVTALALNASGDQIAVARGSSIQVMSSKASNLSGFATPQHQRIIGMAFSSDDYLIALLTDDGAVLLQSVHTGQEMMRLDTGDETLRAVAFSADNKIMGLFAQGDRVVLHNLT